MVIGDPVSDARRRVISVFLVQGVAGLAVVLWLTWLRRDETVHILRTLGTDAPILIAIFVVFATILALLKFELTDLIFVSLSMTAYFVFAPLLGVVITSWLAVTVAMITRILGMRSIGPTAGIARDRRTELARTFGLFGTYGIPVAFGGTVYGWLGGTVPVSETTVRSSLLIAVCAVVMIATNLLIMFRPARAYGYSLDKIARLDLIDASIYLLTVPYAVVTALAYHAVGWGAVLALAFTGAMGNYIARSLALTRANSEQVVQRLASLTADRKSTRLNSSHSQTSYAVFCLKKKKTSSRHITSADRARWVCSRS